MTTAESYLHWLIHDSEDGARAPRVLLIAAHPDDETIGAASRLPLLTGLTLAHVTDGAPRNGADATAQGFSNSAEYARARREELLSALQLAGIAPEQTRAFGYCDQEAALHLPELTLRIAVLIAELRPEVLITHPYEGGHPDHDATAFAVHTACARLPDGVPAPALVELTSYHNSHNGIEVCEFLFRAGHSARTHVLSPAERSFKRRMLDCFHTQQQTLSIFPIEIERFRVAPEYDFTSAPHEGRLYYELFPWGLDGARFRALAAEALERLGLMGRV